MSNDNVERVRRGFEAFERGDLDPIERMIDPDVEWIAHEPGPWDCHGRDQVMGVIRDRLREGVTGSLDEVIGADDRVMICLRDPRIAEFLGVGTDRIYNVFTFRDGRVVRMRDHLDRQLALADAGITG